jgi:hypothetical protein
VAHRYALVALLAGSLLLGLAQIAVLPPFEGADEVAHYSYIQQVGETGTWPQLGDPLSGEIDDYRRLAPLPKAAGEPWTYHNFFESSADVIAAGRAQAHRLRNPSRPWMPGSGENWQAQHPPLYYLLLSPVYLATKSWGLIDQLFALRLFSYLIAWGAIGLAIMTASRVPRGEAHTQNASRLAPALWPALFPMWFPEMARLGNDSLLAAMSALAWAALIHLHAEPARVRSYLLLGIICGLGLLTKAMMAPFVVAVGGYLIFRAWKLHGAGVPTSKLFACLAVFGVAVALIAGWWYGLKLIRNGSLTGSVEMIRLQAAGGLLKGLHEHGSVRDFALGLMMTSLTFLWGGTWSFVMPALALFAPFAVLLLLLAVGWLGEVRQSGEPLDAVPVLTLVLFAAGLALQALVIMALVGPSVAPGWYLHAVMPILAPALGLALAGAIAMRAARWATFAAMLYAPFFLVFAMISQAVFYAGCGAQRPSPFAPGLMCGLDASTIYDRLSVLAHPQAATVLLMAGALSLLGGVISASVVLHPHSRASS